MNSPVHKLNISNSRTATLLLSTVLMIAAAPSMADEFNIAYVDSVHKWGAWELDIEPAAGGLSQPATQALNARGSKVTPRTNSFSALAPPQREQIPVLPIIPPVTPPTMTPISPNVPIPSSAPNDGF